MFAKKKKKKIPHSRVGKIQKSTYKKKKVVIGTSMVIQWLRLCASTAGGVGSIPGQGPEILLAMWRENKTKQQGNLCCVPPSTT